MRRLCYDDGRNRHCPHCAGIWRRRRQCGQKIRPSFCAARQRQRRDDGGDKLCRSFRKKSGSDDFKRTGGEVPAF